MRYHEAVATLLAVAEVRAGQWAAAQRFHNCDEGALEDVVDELYEADGDECSRMVETIRESMAAVEASEAVREVADLLDPAKAIEDDYDGLIREAHARLVAVLEG